MYASLSVGRSREKDFALRTGSDVTAETKHGRAICFPGSSWRRRLFAVSAVLHRAPQVRLRPADELYRRLQDVYASTGD